MNKADFDAIYGDDEVLLPDGWDGESDIFAEDGSLNDDAFSLDEGEEVTGEDTENVNEEPESENAPTTGEEAEGGDQSADDEESGADPDGDTAAETKPTRILKLKVNHKEKEVDINSMTDEEVIALLQKGYAFDSRKEADNKETYRRVYQEQMDSGMTEAVAKLVAQSAAGGKEYALEDAEVAEEPVEETPVAKETVRDFVAEVEQLRALYPDFKETPEEVAKAVAKGVPLLSAYIAYREKISSKTAASLKKENAVLKQNAASSAKAPVKGVTGGGATNPQKKDFFIEGFDSDNW